MSERWKGKVVSLSGKCLWEWGELGEVLKEVMKDVVELCPVAAVIITSIGRDMEREKRLGRSGIHADGPPWRAVDLVWKGMTQEELEELADKVNERWVYDPERDRLKVCYVKPHGTGIHAHIQVHPSTARK